MPRPRGHMAKATDYNPELEARQRNWRARYDAAIVTIRGCLAQDMILCACDTLEYAYWLWMRRPGRGGAK